MKDTDGRSTHTPCEKDAVAQEKVMTAELSPVHAAAPAAQAMKLRHVTGMNPSRTSLLFVTEYARMALDQPGEAAGSSEIVGETEGGPPDGHA